jgi:hypothetical protein
MAVVDAKALDLTQLWNAEAYWNSGRCPWTIFAYPALLADQQLLPRDEESVRYLRALVAAGAQVGIWRCSANDTVYFACSFEEKERVASIVNELEREGAFPKHFARDHCEHLFRLTSQPLST